MPDLWLMLHILGFIVGAGSALVLDLSFARFLLRPEAIPWQPRLYARASRVVWAALSLILVSGAGLFAQKAEALLHAPKFQVKVCIVLALIVNGLALHRSVFPRLGRIFAQDSSYGSAKRNGLRRRAFLAGAVSSVSWTSAFVLGMMHSSPLPFIPLLGVYLGLLGLAALASFGLAKLYELKSRSRTERILADVADHFLSERSIFDTRITLH